MQIFGFFCWSNESNGSNKSNESGEEAKFWGKEKKISPPLIFFVWRAASSWIASGSLGQRRGGPVTFGAASFVRHLAFRKAGAVLHR